MKSSFKSWNWPWISPQIVTGALTWDTFDSLIRISFAYVKLTLDLSYLFSESSDFGFRERFALEQGCNLSVYCSNTLEVNGV